MAFVLEHLAGFPQPDGSFAGKVVVELLVDRSEVAGFSHPGVVVACKENFVSKVQNLTPATFEVLGVGGEGL